MPNSAVKTFVIDTNVLIHRPDAILSFKDNEIVIPLYVLEELDKLKSESGEKGRNARHAIRFLDDVCKAGNVNEGVKIENGSILRVCTGAGSLLPDDLSYSKMDNRILATAVGLQKEGRRVFFVSKDINARVKAQALGIKAVDYEKQKVDVSHMYCGFTELKLPPDQLNALIRDGILNGEQSMIQNQYAIMPNENPNDNVVARYDAPKKRLVLMQYLGGGVSGIKPLNTMQRIAFDLLLDKNIPLVSLVGIAGTGKTLMAIAAGLQLVFEDKKYDKVLVSRPVVPMGKDIGYLPGAKDEKMAHWMQPLFDNLEYILTVYHRNNIKSAESLINSKQIEIEALTYIRGRSLPNQFIIIDEAQNLSPHEIKTIVSRAGDGTKVVLTGDPYQIDSPYLDANSNGLSYLVETLKGQDLFGHVLLTKTERSPLSELAARFL